MNSIFGIFNKISKALDIIDGERFSIGDNEIVFCGKIFSSRGVYELFADNGDLDKKKLETTEGQFTFVLHNKTHNKLVIARDHVGICQLYTYENDEVFAFSSNIYSLLKITKKREINKQALSDYFGYRYNIQNGKTLFEGINRFPAAHILEISMNSGKTELSRYWRLQWQSSLNDNEIQPALNNALNTEIKSQSIYDSALGIYLSGGIDSRAIIHGIGRHDKLHAFTLCFDEKTKEEVEPISQKYGAISHFINYSSEDVSALLEDTVRTMEEPFGDLIICSNAILASNASRDVKIALSGEGGDEVFFGYNHQRAFLKLLSLCSNKLTKYCTKAALSFFPAAMFKCGYPGKFSKQEVSHIRKIVNLADSPAQAYATLSTLFYTDEKLFINDMPPPDIKPLEEIFLMEKNLLRASIRAEIEQLTLGINLLKQDKIGSLYGIEARVPFVSKKVLNIASRISPATIMRNPNKKFVRNYSGCFNVKKHAFSVLDSTENKSMLISLYDKYVNRDNAASTGILNPDFTEGLRKELLRGGMMAQKRCMSLLIFMVWFDIFIRRG